MPTRTDSNNVQPGGLDENTLKEKVVSHPSGNPANHKPILKGLEVAVEPFPTMSHGFLTRGNMEDPKVAAEVTKISQTITLYTFPGCKGNEYHCGFPQQPIWKVENLTCTDGKRMILF